MIVFHCAGTAQDHGFSRIQFRRGVLAVGFSSRNWLNWTVHCIYVRGQLFGIVLWESCS